MPAWSCTRVVGPDTTPRRTSADRQVRLIAAILVGVAALLSGGCADDGTVGWRGLTVTLPEGWVVHEQLPTAFAITDAPLGSREEPGPGEVGAFFQVAPGDGPAAWRDLAERRGWVVEEDRATTVGGVPATQLVVLAADARTPTREMIVLIASRQLTIVLQPVPLRGDTTGPETFQRHRGEFEAILDSIVFGAPVQAAPTRR